MVRPNPFFLLFASFFVAAVVTVVTVVAVVAVVGYRNRSTWSSIWH